VCGKNPPILCPQRGGGDRQDHDKSEQQVKMIASN
jgi:hypothetical protein